MASWTARRSYHGKAVNEGLRQILVAGNKMLATSRFGGEKGDATMYQGSWSGARASAGTHTGPDAFDISEYNWKNRVKVFRILGMAIWHRPYRRNVWVGHIHGITVGGASNAEYQVREYLNRYDGLAGSGRDPSSHYRPSDLPIKFRKDGDLRDRYCKVACHLYDEPAATKQRQGVKVGDKITDVVAVVKAGSGHYWFVTADGRCGYEDNFQITKPSAAKPTPIPGPKPTPIPAPKPTPKPTVTIFDIAFWNVASSKPGWFGVPWGQRGDEIGDLLSDLATSIVCCAETHYSYQTADIGKGLGSQFKHVSSPIGNDMFFDAEKYKQTRPYVEYDLDAQNRRAGVLHLTRIATSEPLTVVNTHFPYGSSSLRTKAAKNLVKLLKQVDDPIILTGDFNNQSFGSGTPHRLLRDAGFEFMREQATVKNGTWHEFPKKSQWLSDIATDPPAAEITSGSLTYTSSKWSDHRPLKARIEIK